MRTRSSVVGWLAVVGLLVGLAVAPASGQESPAPAESSGGGGGVAGQAHVGSGGLSSEPADAPDGVTSPEAEGASAESVIGADGRTQVNNTTAYPSSAIGQIEFQQDFSPFICTGWLVDPNTVVTAGHCVHEGGTGSNADFSTNVLFAPGRNGANNPFGTCGATELFTTTQWVDTANPQHDWGMIQLDCNIGEVVGWFGYRSLTNAQLLGRNVTVRGYPGDKPAGTMWSMNDAVRALVARSVRYRADTAGGQSGAPVYEATGCGGPCGLAVHAYGCPGGAPCPPPNNHNSGPRLTAGRVDTIYGFAAENDDHPDALIRRSTGSFVGDDRVNLSGAGQSLSSLNLPAGVTRNHVVRVENEGSSAQPFTVKGNGSTPNFTVRYFSGATNITPQVVAGTHQTASLAAGAHADIRVEVKIKNTAPKNAEVTVKVTTSALASPFYQDVVRTTVGR